MFRTCLHHLGAHVLLKVQGVPVTNKPLGPPDCRAFLQLHDLDGFLGLPDCLANEEACNVAHILSAADRRRLLQVCCIEHAEKRPSGHPDVEARGRELLQLVASQSASLAIPALACNILPSRPEPECERSLPQFGPVTVVVVAAWYMPAVLPRHAVNNRATLLHNGIIALAKIVGDEVCTRFVPLISSFLQSLFCSVRSCISPIFAKGHLLSTVCFQENAGEILLLSFLRKSP